MQILTAYLHWISLALVGAGVFAQISKATKPLILIGIIGAFSSGLLRLGLEKGGQFYFANPLFLLKILMVLVLGCTLLMKDETRARYLRMIIFVSLPLLASFASRGIGL